MYFNNTASSAAPQIHCVGGCWDRTHRLLRLWHWQSDALNTLGYRFRPQLGKILSTTRLDIIHTRQDLIHTWQDLKHTRQDLIHNSARYHPHSARSHPHSARSHPHSARSQTHLARSHPQLGQISSTRIHTVHGGQWSWSMQARIRYLSSLKLLTKLVGRIYEKFEFHVILNFKNKTEINLFSVFKSLLGHQSDPV